MAERTAKIKIEVDNKQAKGKLDEVEKGIGKLESQVGQLGRVFGAAFAFAGIGAAVKAFGALAEQFTQVQNRLRTVTNSQQELGQITREIGAIADRSRGSFVATAEVYTRLASSAKGLGLSQGRLLQLTESLNNAVTLSGATSETAKAGLVQLSQGLAAGALRGDELNSVLEGLPIIADVIAAKLGVTRGELKAMGEQGKITTQVVVDGFKDMRKELAANADKAVPTVGQAFEKLKNNLIQGAGAFDQATGATATFAKAVNKLAEVLPPVARFLTSMFQTPLASIIALGEAIKLLPELLESAFKSTINSIIGFTQSAINKLIEGLNSVSGLLRIPKIDAIEFDQLEVNRKASVVAADMAKVFKTTFNNAINPEEGKDVSLAKSGGISPDQALINKLSGLAFPGAAKLKGHFGEGEDAVFGTMRLEVEKFNGEISKTPDLIGNVIEVFDPFKTTVQNAIGTARESFASFFTDVNASGKAAFKDLADSILADLARVFFNKAAAGLLRSFGGADLAAQLFPGFAGGGSFTVGGSGGTDSQFVGLRATPGEKVTVATPAQQQTQQPLNVRVINQLDPGLAVDALSTAAGERVILNIIQRNPNAVRRILGGG